MFDRQLLTGTLGAIALLVATGAAQAIPLQNGLGGTAGFGENSLAPNDDGSLGVDLSPIFSTPLNFFGTSFQSLYINNNGNVTLNSALTAYTPAAITGSTSNPIIAPFFADVDTRGGSTAVTPGGNSTGANTVWYDLDVVNQIFTVTWDDVGYYNSETSLANAFQLALIGTGSGNFDIEFRYEDINWTTGSSSGGVDGLGGTVARAGFSSGNGVDFFELPESGNQAAILDLENRTNTTPDGRYLFSVQDGLVVDPPSEIPTPGTLPLLAAGGLFGIAPLLRRRRRQART